MQWVGLQLRRRHLPQALELFTRVIARREHVASLRDAAECLHRLERNEEAPLKFLHRAKKQESENPFVLDLESRILEDLGQLAPAYESALLASARDPMNAHMQNRLGIIRSKQGSPALAIDHFKKAIELDQDLFSPVHSLASAYLDVGDVVSAEHLLPALQAKARTPSDSSLLRHTEARIAFSKRDFDKSQEILKREITLFHNVVPNLGMLIRVEFALFDQNLRDFPAIAALSLRSAEAALDRIVALDQFNDFIDTLRSQLEERQSALKRGNTVPRVPGAPPERGPVTPSSKVPAAPQGKAPATLPGSSPVPLPNNSRKKPALKPPLMLPPKTPFNL